LAIWACCPCRALELAVGRFMVACMKLVSAVALIPMPDVAPSLLSPHKKTVRVIGGRSGKSIDSTSVALEDRVRRTLRNTTNRRHVLAIVAEVGIDDVGLVRFMDADCVAGTSRTAGVTHDAEIGFDDMHIIFRFLINSSLKGYPAQPLWQGQSVDFFFITQLLSVSYPFPNAIVTQFQKAGCRDTGLHHRFRKGRHSASRSLPAL